MGKQQASKSKKQTPSKELLDQLAENVADHAKPLSLWPLTLDQAVSVALTAPPMPKDKKPAE